MESKHKGTFNAQTFLDSAGIARKIVEYRGGEVNVFMKKFQRLGFIDYTDGLKVNNSLLTVVLHD